MIELGNDVFQPDAVSEATKTFNQERREAASRKLPPIPAQPQSPLAQTISIPGRVGNEIRLRVLVPDRASGVYLYFHGGGWSRGRYDSRDGDMARMGDRAGLATVSVDYRLSDRHPYPAGPDDCESAARWLIQNAGVSFGTKRLLIGGDSAGAQLAVLTLLRLREDGLAAAFAGVNLIFGHFDLSLTPSARAAVEGILVDRQQLEESVATFVRGACELRDPLVSPLYSDLRGLPSALFTVGTLDPLLDDTLFMYARWLEAGNSAHLAVYPGGSHAFVHFDFPLAREANERIDRFLAEQD